jgi:hypothetical protein
VDEGGRAQRNADVDKMKEMRRTFVTHQVSCVVTRKLFTYHEPGRVNEGDQRGVRRRDEPWWAQSCHKVQDSGGTIGRGTPAVTTAPSNVEERVQHAFDEAENR